MKSFVKNFLEYFAEEAGLDNGAERKHQFDVLTIIRKETNEVLKENVSECITIKNYWFSPNFL